MSKIISIASPKGGVGKTTTALNLSIALTKHYKKTLLIDADPGRYCTLSLEFTDNEIFGDIFDLFTYTKTFREIIHKTKIPFLEVIPFREISVNEENQLLNLAKNELVIKQALENNSDYYDFIIIDCPPYLNGITTNALLASDSVIVPIKSSNYSIQAVKRIQSFIKELNRQFNSPVNLEGILLTMYEANTKTSFLTKKLLFSKFPNLTFKTTIPKNVSITEATFYKKPVISINSSARASQAYLKLAEELIENIETKFLMNSAGLTHDDFHY